jgi:hypothetical protein
MRDGGDPDGTFLIEWVGDWTSDDLSDWHNDRWQSDTTGGDVQSWLDGTRVTGTLTRMRARLAADQLRDTAFVVTRPSNSPSAPRWSTATSGAAAVWVDAAWCRCSCLRSSHCDDAA